MQWQKSRPGLTGFQIATIDIGDHALALYLEEDDKGWGLALEASHFDQGDCDRTETYLAEMFATWEDAIVRYQEILAEDPSPYLLRMLL